MTKLLSDTEFLEVDTTYNENSELIYLFTATVFDYTTMKWAVVARMRRIPISIKKVCFIFAIKITQPLQKLSI